MRVRVRIRKERRTVFRNEPSTKVAEIDGGDGALIVRGMAGTVGLRDP